MEAQLCWCSSLVLPAKTPLAPGPAPELRGAVVEAGMDGTRFN